MLNLISRFKSIDENEKTAAVQKVVSQATPDFDFFFMMSLSVLMATFGLLAGSEAIVIGSMLLAPLMYPILSLGLGLSMSNTQVIIRASQTLLKAMVLSLISAGLVTLFFVFSDDINILNDVIMSRASPSLLYFAVAFLSGIAISYTTIKPHLSSALVGVAVSVALIPPLAVAGIGLASLNFPIAFGALLMVIVNIAGIIFASMLSFSFMDIHHKKYLATKIIHKEKKRVAMEEKIVEEISNGTKK